jgi:hypothetical protein
MFASTLPQGAPDLMRVSAFKRYLDELECGNVADAGSSKLASLSPSMLQDLMRFERNGRHSELLEVLAACIRHTLPLAVHLQWGDQVLTLTVFPIHKLAHCQVPMERLLDSRLDELKVLQVEPATVRALGDPVRALVGDAALYAALAPMLWAMAMRGSRETLLPEIAGQAAYRVAPGVNLGGLEMSSVLASCVERLRKQTSNLREIAEWPGMDRVRAMRMLNALYLQAGLIASRTHPAATNEGWSGYR